MHLTIFILYIAGMVPTGIEVTSTHKAKAPWAIIVMLLIWPFFWIFILFLIFVAKNFPELYEKLK